ncbi:MAG TPA: hypothetical protein VE869_06225 [Gemmatimonas sp.]|nr:hypothetical protein [Gemmatimonas sp.]
MIRQSVGLCMLAALICSASPNALDAQPTRDSTARGRRPQAGERGSGGRGFSDRATMERRFEARLNEILRTKLRLSDDQLRQLRAVSNRVEREKRDLWRSEEHIRGELRRQLLASEPASESRIAELLDSLPRLERRRIDAMEQEQRELARFLAPSQRARYFALQDEIRRGMQEMQRGRLGGSGDRGNRGASDGGGRPPKSAPPRQGPPGSRP